MRKFIFVRTEFFVLPHGAKFSFARRLDFLPQENLFPHGRKNIFLRKEISCLAEGVNFSCAQKYFFVRTKI